MLGRIRQAFCMLWKWPVFTVCRGWNVVKGSKKAIRFECLIISNLCFKWIKQFQTKWLSGCHKLHDSLVEEVRNLDIFVSTAKSLGGRTYKQAIAAWFNCSRGLGYCQRRRCFVQSALHTTTVTFEIYGLKLKQGKSPSGAADPR